MKTPGHYGTCGTCRKWGTEAEREANAARRTCLDDREYGPGYERRGGCAYHVPAKP